MQVFFSLFVIYFYFFKKFCFQIIFRYFLHFFFTEQHVIVCFHIDFMQMTVNKEKKQEKIAIFSICIFNNKEFYAVMLCIQRNMKKY